VTDYLSEGQDVRVKVLEIDNRGRVKLSIKEAQLEEGGAAEESAETTED
jgi:polyribonucleotide nucleotidyltransferase